MHSLLIVRYTYTQELKIETINTTWACHSSLYNISSISINRELATPPMPWSELPCAMTLNFSHHMIKVHTLYPKVNFFVWNNNLIVHKIWFYHSLSSILTQSKYSLLQSSQDLQVSKPSLDLHLQFVHRSPFVTIFTL